MKSIINGVSVVIPTFNRAKFIYPTLLCLLNQKNLNIGFEIVIIDSGNDETSSLIKTFQNIFPDKIQYKKIKKCKNRSLLRNIGAKIAKFNLLCFIDNDILVPPNFLETQLINHLETENLVLLGARKSLIDFDIEKIGEENLKENFQLLDTLPWYNDERLDKNINIQPWRYVFSHTLSMRKNIFNKVGGFNKLFGENWGYEDLELGFKLMNLGCSFKLIKDTFTYHQPHFSQSKIEQNLDNSNGELFLRLHNCFELELYQCFYTLFDTFYPILNTIKQTYSPPNKSKQRKYDLIFGCLISSEEKQKSKKMFLGSTCIKKINSAKKILILNTWFDFPEILQISILTEAFKIGRKIYFENINEENKKYLFSILKKAGITGICKQKNTSYVFSKTGEKETIFFDINLPSVLEPEKRYVYTWLGRYLEKKGCYIKLRDTKNTNIISNEDFSLNKTDTKELSSTFSMYFGNIPCNYITSLSVILTETNFGLPNISNNYIFHDLDFLLKTTTLKFRKSNFCNHLDESYYSLVSYCSVFEACQLVDRSTPHNDYIVFMENGYLEDGIDIVLEAFSEYIKTNQNATLTIKMPDFSQVLENCYPMHNKASKETKLLGLKHKIEIEFHKLNKQIHDLNISSNVKLLRKNLNIGEIANLVAQHKTIILSSRTTCVPPQMYIGLLLDKNVIIAKHHFIHDDFKQYLLIVDSNERCFYEDFDFPPSSLNVNYFSNIVNMKSLLDSFSLKSQKMPPEIKTKSAIFILNLLDKVFVKDL